MNKLATLVIMLAMFSINTQNLNPKSQINSNNQITKSRQVPTSTPVIIPTPTIEPLRSVLYEVPFTSQAPTAEWGNSIFQDGCEEAAAIMAYCAIPNNQCPISNGKIESNYARDEIVKMAEWQKSKYGSAVDTSAKHTGERLLGEYFANDKYPLAGPQISNIKSKEEIIRVLMKGNIVIVPTDGRKLGNPNFKNGGPVRHMLLIRGYNLESREFVTNDPGTRLGEKYRYDEDVLFEAIRDYENGDHAPITEIRKLMIVI